MKLRQTYTGIGFAEKNIKNYTMPSSVISYFKYDAAKKTLKIVYVSGAVYNYLDVSQPVYDGLVHAKSKGTYLNTKIKGRFQYEKIHDPNIQEFQ